MGTSGERYKELLAKARAKGSGAQANDQAAQLLTTLVDRRRPDGTAATLTEQEVKARLSPLIRAFCDMEGTSQGFVKLFSVDVSRAAWPTISLTIQSVLSEWEDRLEQAHGVNGPSFVAELGYAGGRGAVRQGRSHGRFESVDDAVAARGVFSLLAQRVKACGVEHYTRPLGAEETKPALVALFAASRWCHNVRQFGVRGPSKLWGEMIHDGEHLTLCDHLEVPVAERLKAWARALEGDHGDVGVSLFVEMAFDGGGVDGSMDLSFMRTGPDRLTLRQAKPRARLVPSVPPQIDWSTVFDESAPLTPGIEGEALRRLLSELAAPFSPAELSEMDKYAGRNRGNRALVNPLRPDRCSRSWLSFLAWSNGGHFATGRREFSSMLSLREVREYMIAYCTPVGLPDAIPFAMDGSAGFYLFDVREAPVDGEFPIVACHSTETETWRNVRYLEASFYECCRR